MEAVKSIKSIKKILLIWCIFNIVFTVASTIVISIVSLRVFDKAKSLETEVRGYKDVLVSYKDEIWAYKDSFDKYRAWFDEHEDELEALAGFSEVQANIESWYNKVNK